MYRQRKVIFLARACRKIPVVADQEINRYDSEDIIYRLAKENLEGPLLVSVRLLPTTRPHLMNDLLPAACRDATRHGLSVREVSRFGTAPELPDHDMRLRMLWELICGVMEAALLYEVERVIFSANRALLALALTCRWEVTDTGALSAKNT